MEKGYIHVKGAKEHNLKNIEVSIPRNEFVVITGLSGSGKSSLAFDTIFAEGQRRYMESLSSYARQFLGQMEKPDVEYIEGLSPAISIDQKTTARNPRSTVGTVTEIYDYMRLLYARIGIPHCPQCGKIISRQSVDQMVDAILEIKPGTRIQILAPVVRGRKGEYGKLFEDIKKMGFIRIRVDGSLYEAGDEIKLDRNRKHDIEIVVDRLVVKDEIRKRLAESVETALRLSNGILLVDVEKEGDVLFSQNFACVDCGINIEELTPRMFSFNNPYGACPDCTGLGSLLKMDEDLIVPNGELSLRNGAIAINGWNINNTESYGHMIFKALSHHYEFSLDTPFKDLPEHIKDIILHGTGKEKIKIKYTKEYGTGYYNAAFDGIMNISERRHGETQSDSVRQYYEEFMTNTPCKTCKGARLKREALAVTVGDKNISDLTAMAVTDIKDFLLNLKLSNREELIAGQILKEMDARLGFLVNVGLDYLTLSRMAGTLSGGEAQRIRLATQIGSGLVGVLYILDEPSIGLHQKDNKRLIDTLKDLRDLGNTLIVVEHDEDTMYAADHIIDLGPGAGINGGEVVAAGSITDIMGNDKSITGQYLSGKKRIEIPGKRRPGNGHWLEIKGARQNNLKNIDVKIPLGTITSVTGVSGSGKSSLVNEILYKQLARELNRAKTRAGDHDLILGVSYLDKVINIDQSPIGRTPRSNPATYTGVFDTIREVYSNTTEAKMRGYSPGRFSFNIRGGRCESCKGDGINKIEMHFLPDVYVPCDVCKGMRYNRETLEVRYKGKNIAQVLDMTVEDAMEFFANIPRIERKLRTLYEVGLGYIKLGQSSTTLSGGEAQRVKLSTELSKRSTGKTIYILDEPTTGLHAADVHKLIDVLTRLVETGNTVVIIEHNLDVVKTSDYIIDLGPEGGARGGYVIATGTPEHVSELKDSYTGIYLKNIISRGKII